VSQLLPYPDQLVNGTIPDANAVMRDHEHVRTFLNGKNLGADNIEDGGITASLIADGAVLLDEPGSVSRENIADDAIGPDQIAPGAVGIGDVVGWGATKKKPTSVTMPVGTWNNTIINTDSLTGLHLVIANIVFEANNVDESAVNITLQMTRSGDDWVCPGNPKMTIRHNNVNEKDDASIVHQCVAQFNGQSMAVNGYVSQGGTVARAESTITAIRIGGPSSLVTYGEAD
tara:strand:- start:134 stop:823 length:690 start_codon:yes stop_codon:yes gene_type:complete